MIQKNPLKQTNDLERSLASPCAIGGAQQPNFKKKKRRLFCRRCSWAPHQSHVAVIYSITAFCPHVCSYFQDKESLWHC